MFDNGETMVNVNVNQDRSIDVDLPNFSVNSVYCEIEEVSNITLDTKYEFNTMHLNIHSLPDKFLKLKDILARLFDCGILIDFILLCETYLTDIKETKYHLRSS